MVKTKTDAILDERKRLIKMIRERYVDSVNPMLTGTPLSPEKRAAICARARTEVAELGLDPGWPSAVDRAVESTLDYEATVVALEERIAELEQGERQ